MGRISTGTRTRREWLADIGVVLFGLVLSTLSIPFHQPASGGLLPVAPLPLDLAVGGLAGVALWFRRRWPALVAVPLIVLSIGFPAVSGPSGLALFTTAIHARLRVTVGVTAIAVGSVALAYWLYPVTPHTPITYWIVFGFTALWCVVLAAWGVILRTRRQLVRSLADRAERAETEQQLRVEQGRRREREWIAREMHDALGHRLSLLSVHAGALEFRPDMPADELSRAAGVIRASAHQCLTDLREIIAVLRSVDADRPAPTLADLPELIKESAQAGMTIDLDIQLPDLAEVPPAIGRHGFRIVQESLTNARKHAPGRPVRLTVGGGPGDGLVLQATNPAPPPATPSAIPGSGLGLAGLSERANLAGGLLIHGRGMTGEFLLRAWLPWPA